MKEVSFGKNFGLKMIKKYLMKKKMIKSKVYSKATKQIYQSRKRASTPVLRLYVRPQINPQINEKVAIFLEFTNSRGHSAWPQKALDSFGSPITPL